MHEWSQAMRVHSKQELLDFTIMYKDMLGELNEYKLRAYHHEREIQDLRQRLTRILQMEVEVDELRSMLRSILESSK